MNTRSLIYFLLSGAAAILFFGTLPVPASASSVTTDEVGLSYSTDGVTYSADPPPIFADLPRLVPGGEVHGVLWIRNSRSHAVDVSLRMEPTKDSSGILLGPTDSGTSILGVGETTAVTVRAWLPPSADNETQNEISESIRISVHASEATRLVDLPERPEEQTSGKPDLRSPGALGDTGYDPRALPLAFGALVTGAVLYAKSRKRQRQKIDTDGKLH